MFGQENRVAISGMGVLAANGVGLDAFWESLLRGESGIGRATLFDTDGLTSNLAGEVSGFDPYEFIDTTLKPKRMGRFTQLGVVAASMALEDSGITVSDLKNQDLIPVVIGVSTNAMDLIANKPSTTTAVAAIPHAVTSAIGYVYDIQTQLHTVSNGCASSLDAIAYAAKLIRDGITDVAMAGGAESTMSRYAYESMLKTRRCCSSTGDPREASRPFDVDRTGGVIAEGAGLVVLENLDSAMARGHQPYALLEASASSAPTNVTERKAVDWREP